MIVKLDDVCRRIYAGGDVPKDRFSDKKTDIYNIPIYANAEANQGLYGYTDEAREYEPAVTVAARGTIGYSAIRTTPFLPVVRLITVVPDESEITLRYLYYALKHYKPKSSGTSIPQLTVPNIKKYSFNLYDINKQEMITDTLDKLQFIITHRKQQLAKLDELVKARFVEMFGEIDLTPQRAEWIPISSIGTVIGGSTPKTSVEEYWDGDLKWITPAELLPDTGYLYDSVRKITKAGVDSCSLQLLPKDTVLLTSRAPIGKVAIAGTEMYCNQGFKNIICNDTILPRYLYSLLLYNVDYLNSLGRGATFKEISKSIVEKIKIPIAPIELQNQFAAFVSQTDKSKVIHIKLINIYNRYKRRVEHD